MKYGSLKCPHCEMWSDKWKSVKHDTPKEMFDTYTCNCGGESVWFAGAPVLIRADEVDVNVEWRVRDEDGCH